MRLPLARRARLLGRRAGLDVRRWREVAGYDLAPFRGRVRLLQQLEASVALDVGANRGQWALALRSAGFGGPIVSFEPLREPFTAIEARCATDPGWEVHHLALADADGQLEMNVALDSAGSSVLGVSSRMINAIPAMSAVGRETVPSRRLDSIALPGGPYFLKIDVQGFERWVLDGAAGILAQVPGAELELSFHHLYDGDATIREMLDLMHDRGYELLTVIPGILDPTHDLPLQVDGIFVRRELSAVSLESG